MKVLMDDISFSGLVNHIHYKKTKKWSYTPTIKAYAGEIVCDTVFLNPVPNTKYQHTPMKTGVGEVTVRLKQVLLPNITMMKIDKINTLSKRCKKRETIELGAQRMSNENIYELLEEIHKRDKLNTYFNIEYDGEDINVD